MQKIEEAMPALHGPFRDAIPGYIKYRQAIGYKTGHQLVSLLRNLDSFSADYGITSVSIPRELYYDWTARRPGEKESYTERRRVAIRPFARFLVGQGYCGIYTGADDARTFRKDFVPYIFSTDEIASMFAILKTASVASPGYESDSFRLMMQMYYCCGFRKSELTRLRIGDVDFETGKMTVLGGKNNVGRMVVASDSLLRHMQAYRAEYLSGKSPEDYFFHGLKAASYTDETLYKKYHRLLDEAGIPPRADGTRQRLHDLRHTFCVRTLASMEKKGFDLYASLPLLSVYLGHKHIRDTEYYLRMVDAHYGEILEKSEGYIPHLFPPVCAGGGGGSEE